MRTLSPQEEMVLYHRDYAAWCNYAAPLIIKKFADATPEVKKEAWAEFSEPLRAAITKLKQGPHEQR